MGTPFLPTGPTRAWSFAIPNAPWLTGLPVHATSAMMTTPGMNALGLITANGLAGIVGLP